MRRATGFLALLGAAAAAGACATIYGIKDVPTPEEGGISSSGGGDDGSTSSGGSSSNGATSSGSGTSSGASSSGDGGSSGPSSSSTSSSGSSSSGSTSSSGGTLDYSVYQHHKNGTRDGLYIDPVFTKTAAATMHKAFSAGMVTTNVYAQPLYVENGPKGEMIIVATEQNHVTAFTIGANDAGAPISWDHTYGTPTPLSTLPCGNINPLGITGTPVIDNTGAQGVIYFDAETTPAAGMAPKHLIHAVSLADGTELAGGWPVDVSAKIIAFNSMVQQQRGALQLVNGTLYVPYGGLLGDCGGYHGWVVGVSVNSPTGTPASWATMATGGGIWGTGALPTDGTSIFPVTGNTFGATSWMGGEAVIRLPPNLAFSGNTTDYYAPSNWSTLDGSDLDLGGSSEVLFDVSGAMKPHLVAAGGKDGYLYLLDRTNLGGIGGELLKKQISSSQITGAPAAYTTSTGTYVVLHSSGSGVGCPGGQTGNLIAVLVTPTVSMSRVAWCSSQGGLGSPMVTTTDGKSNAIVWAANSALYGFDGDTGAVIAGGANTTMSAAIQAFNTPIAAKGRIVVAVNGELDVFTP
jgi:hypothetical protein